MLALVGLAFAPRVARAGNDDEVLMGNQAGMSAGAVTATASDGAAAWYNPAGVASVERDTVDVSGSLYGLRLYHVPAFLSAATGEQTPADKSEIVSIPAALTYVRPLGHDVRAAVGLFVPKSGDLRLRERLDTVMPVSSTWILAIESAATTYYASGSVAFRLGPRFRLGVALEGIYRSDAAQAGFYGGVSAMMNTGVFTSTTDASRWGLGVDLVAGAQWDPSDHLSLGLAIRSPSLDFYRSLSVDSVTADAATGMMASAELVPNQTRDGGFEAASASPPRVRAGIAARFAHGWVALDGDVQPAWTSHAWEVNRDLVWNARLGGRFRLGKNLAIGAGVFTDRSADPTPQSFPDSHIDFYGGTLGIELDHVHLMAAHEEAHSITFSTTLALRYAYGTGTVEGLSIDFNDPNIVGSHPTDITVHEIGVQLGSALYF